MTPSPFERILVGVDGGAASFEACRQVARLAEPGAAIEALAVVHLTPPVDETAVDRLQLEADAALARTLELLGDRARTRCVNGFVTEALLEESRRIDATLLAIGTHGHSRAGEILLGGPAGELLHRSPCSVLVARPVDAPQFPRRIVVGHDGSSQADAAFDAGEHLAQRFGSELVVVTALDGKGVHLDRVRARATEARLVERHPVHALVEAAREADLLVVGSRGLHGLKALGSVSERVAHQAGCSVLVVRRSPSGLHNTSTSAAPAGGSMSRSTTEGSSR